MLLLYRTWDSLFSNWPDPTLYETPTNPLDPGPGFVIVDCFLCNDCFFFHKIFLPFCDIL